MMTAATRRADGFRHYTFYFNPEAQVGNGATPDDDTTSKPEARRAPLPEDETASTTQTSTETTPPSTTH